VSGARAAAPADYPPDLDSRAEFIRRELDSEDDRIEVGIAIVGGGTVVFRTE
jgi:electron-transferring-flavoprotein dehydrogenase